MSERRLAWVQMTGQALAALASSRTAMQGGGLPPDARFLSASYHDQTQSFRLYFESSAFDPVPEGYSIPQWTDAIFARSSPGHDR